MPYEHRKTNTILFSEQELKRLFELPTRLQILREMFRSLHPTEVFRQNRALREELISKVNMIQDKEDVEIFATLYFLLEFYPSSKIGFKLRDGIDPRTINSIAKLKSSIKENDLTDFGLMTDGNYREFQLKSFRGNVEIEEFFGFLKNKLSHYGNDIGNVNLMINLQGTGDIPENFFESIHEKLKSLRLKGGGHILISYNEENRVHVMNTVYPMLGSTRIEHEPFVTE